MDNFAFDDFFEQQRPHRTGSSRSKPVKRKWREIEMLKDRAKLRKELQDIDLLAEPDDWDVDI